MAVALVSRRITQSASLVSATLSFGATIARKIRQMLMLVVARNVCNPKSIH